MFQLLVWVLVGALYYPVLFQLYAFRWQLIDYTHAYFVLPICLLMVWLKRKELTPAITPESSSAAYAALMILGVFLFVFGWQKNFLLISTFSLIPLATGMLGYLYGHQTVRVLKFPLLFLFFLVPPPAGILDALTLPMRHGISVAVAVFLRSFYIPIHTEGLLLYLDHQEIFMAPACSGFRSLITFLALASVYVYFVPSSAKQKIILMTSVIPLALLGNFVRVVILCLITYFLGEAAGQGFLHALSGFIVFLVIILGFMAIDRTLNPSPEEM